MFTEDIFPEDFLAQLPDAVRGRLPDLGNIYVKEVAAYYGEKTETFMYDINRPLDSPMEYYAIKLKSNILGYVLTSLLNINFEAVSEIVADLEWEDTADKHSDPPINYAEIYNRLLSVSDVFKFYLPTEWTRIQDDLEVIQYGVAHTVEMLRKYIAFCNRKNESYNGKFFDFLILNGFFEILPVVILHSKQIEALVSLFNDDGELVANLDEIHDYFLNSLDPDTADLNCYTSGPEDRLRDIAMISFNEIASRGKTIRQCQICGKYFIPAKRADTLYCDNPSPEVPEMTCKEYGNRRLWYERQKEDELATLSRKIASAKGMLAKRNPDIPQYAESYEYFKAQRLIWIKAIKEGTRTQEDYKTWLLSMQSQKIIKEAAHGND